ncbi:DUF885 domain-containing protein [Marihabitans asiaticum]|uniref:Uncharacterized protein (DUF885 family) n=1 Tax=Marihabitans asiaticum TaxID=415218 RepID=A0A560WCQ5_9MICO|nr:DUF885 domain-containing protein [Marihabitans asiaticum]TWD15461.1 uncharacterized protein (DUF885 family) [Marihabitans asiaticum]
MNEQTHARPSTEIDRIAETYLDEELALSPLSATYLGLPGREDEIDDLSPDGLEEMSRLRRRTLDTLDAAEPADEVDRVTLEAMRERLGLAEEMHDAGLDAMELNNIASPMQSVRDVLDLMPSDTEEQWATIGRRVAAIPEALEEYVQSLRHAADRGRITSRRQFRVCAEQARDTAAEGAYLAALPESARTAQGPVPDSLRRDLETSAQAAREGYLALAAALDDLGERAPEQLGCGRERYALYSRQFLGSTVDLEETYAWGQEELARITAQMEQTAQQVRPGASVKEAIAALEDDPAYRLEGTDALQAWMQDKADEAITALAGEHFDIPDPVRAIECRIAPTQTGGIYYTGPSDDFARPGRMWWSVPKGVTTFGTWRELTTVYHEGVPGHHLQVAQTVYRRELLNRWRRLASWTSGHGEGWALYAEWLMAELGYMDDPGNRMGLLDGQSLRAARVVLDIGVHCGFEAPAEVGGGDWTYEKAWAFLDAHANQGTEQLRFELDRYLGWPGQAPSYKIGERLWVELRNEVARREGEAFDLKAFHRRALDIGGVGLDTLRSAVLGPS